MLRVVDVLEASTGAPGLDAHFEAPDAESEGAPVPKRQELCKRGYEPKWSTFIRVASVESVSTLDIPSNGDLWPSCSAGDSLYVAWGDGFGFDAIGSYRRPDIGVGILSGHPDRPESLLGSNRVHDRGTTQNHFEVWSSGSYYQKPTGMLCHAGKIYLAIQDLNSRDYGDAPAASLAVSSDRGASFQQNRSAPMWRDHVFTTVLFLDRGPDPARHSDGFVYAYGLDHNWAHSNSGADPEALYLARIAEADDLMDLARWAYFSGFQGVTPSWSVDIAERQPVLVDCVRRYRTEEFEGHSVLAQGSIVYDAALARYLYTSWTEYTFEFYESPTPWGPWHKFLVQDFGPYPWTAERHGGYATTLPTRFISADGKTLWLQANTWASGIDRNHFSLRRLQLETTAP